MDTDDLTRGTIMSRRAAVALLGAAGYGLLAGSRRAAGQDPAQAGCVVRPAQTEGPYFVDERLERRDIRADPSDGSVRPGTPLELTIAVSRLADQRCLPLAGAVVDVWQCDHDGVYSDVRDPSFDTTGKKFLRGFQRTDAEGLARFTTIYPGWYRGRTVHIHFKVRSPAAVSPAYEFTSQFYFDDTLTDRVLAAAPYASRGPRSHRNADDGIFRRSGGAQLMMALAEQGAGYAGRFNVALRGV